eukprot:6749102-Alexandrium_andersonii.AAC.1
MAAGVRSLNCAALDMTSTLVPGAPEGVLSALLGALSPLAATRSAPAGENIAEKELLGAEAFTSCQHSKRANARGWAKRRLEEGVAKELLLTSDLLCDLR